MRTHAKIEPLRIKTIVVVTSILENRYNGNVLADRIDMNPDKEVLCIIKIPDPNKSHGELRSNSTRSADILFVQMASQLRGQSQFTRSMRIRKGCCAREAT